MDGVGKDLGPLTRRNFIKLSALSLTGLAWRNLPHPEYDIPQDIQETPHTFMVIPALEKVSQEIGNSLYGTKNTYTAAYLADLYLRKFGFASEGELNSLYHGPLQKILSVFPVKDTTTQLDWLQKWSQTYPSENIWRSISPKDIHDVNTWKDISDGSLVFYPSKVGQKQLGDIYGTAVVIGKRFNGSPIFAAYEPGMIGMKTGFTTTDLNIETNIEINPNFVNSDGQIKIFNVIEASRSLWSNEGIVVPNSEKLFQQGINYALTINIHDGTVALFSTGPWGNFDQVPISEERPIIFAMVGRKLPRKNGVSKAYYKAGHSQNGSFYDEETGTQFEPNGTIRHSLSKPLVSILEQFAHLKGFADLPGSTNAALIRPIIITEDGTVVPDGFRSDFTFHEVPRDDEGNDLLGREEYLLNANDPQSPKKGPVDPTKRNITGGCINLDGKSWQDLTTKLNALQKQGNKIGVIMGIPTTNQDRYIKSISGAYYKKKDPLLHIEEWMTPE